MSTAVFEFPLNEKVRTYLRLEQLFKQLNQWQQLKHDWQYIGYLESFFTLFDLLERIDIRSDILKDIDAHERNLVHWSQHPQIDNDALQTTLRRIVKLRDQLKSARKLGSGLKDDKFLAAIRQRFAIPGANCSFDLPSLHYWLNQPQDTIHADIKRWMEDFLLVNQAIDITLSFLRERGRLTSTVAEKGFYQDVADSRCELIRIECDVEQGYYPVLSGNKHRYAIRFMRFNPELDGTLTEENSVTFKQACC